MLAEYNRRYQQRVTSNELSNEKELNRVFTRHCFDLLSEPIYHSIPPDTLFSAAFDRWLGPIYRRCARDFFYYPRIIFRDEDMPELGSQFIDVMTQGNMTLLTKIKGPKVCRTFLREIMELNQILYHKWLTGKVINSGQLKMVKRTLLYRSAFDPHAVVDAAFASQDSPSEQAVPGVAQRKATKQVHRN